MNEGSEPVTARHSKVHQLHRLRYIFDKDLLPKIQKVMERQLGSMSERQMKSTHCRAGCTEIRRVSNLMYDSCISNAVYKSRTEKINNLCG